MFSSRWNYLACYFSIFCCIVCALVHDLPFLIMNLFFAIWNWYLAEYKRGKENETNKDREPGNDNNETKE